MISNEKRQKLETIILGKSIIGAEDHLAAARNYLSERFVTDTATERDFESKSVVKEAQKNSLISFAQNTNLWFDEELSDANFLT